MRKIIFLMTLLVCGTAFAGDWNREPKSYGYDRGNYHSHEERRSNDRYNQYYRYNRNPYYYNYRYLPYHHQPRNYPYQNRPGFGIYLRF